MLFCKGILLCTQMISHLCCCAAFIFIFILGCCAAFIFIFLLACCTAVKAVRLFLKWSRETGLLDVEKLYAQFDIRVGSNRRWINRLPDGSLLTLKPNE